MQRSSKTFACIALSLGALFASHAHAQTTCHDVEVIVARGTLEHLLGPGSMNLDGPSSTGPTWIDHPEGVWTQIRKELQTPTDGSTPTTVVRYDLSPGEYPADLNFFGSATMGTVAMINRINSQHALCPAKQFVLLGYSQGAAVVGNVLSPASRRILNDQTKNNYVLTPSASQKVVAAALFADPGFRGDERTWFNAALYDRAQHGALITSSDWLNNSYEDLNHRMNDGSYTSGATGIVPRPSGTFALYHRDKVRDYCIFNDPICQGGSPSMLGIEHLYYAGDASAKRNLAVFALQKLRSHVDKSIPAYCTVMASSNGSVEGGLLPAKVRFQGTLADVSHADAAGKRLVKLESARASFSFSGTSASYLRNTLLSGSSSAFATLLEYPVEASNTLEGTLDVTDTGMVGYDDIALPSGGSYTFVPESTRSLTFTAASVSGKVEVRSQTSEIFVTGTHPVTGYGVWAALRCYPASSSARKLNTVVLD